MTPKPMEVFTLSGALWYNKGDYANKAGFYMEQRKYVPETTTETGTKIPEKWFNPAGLKGGIVLNTDYNSTDAPTLKPGESYRFLSVAMMPSTGQGTQPNPSGAPLRAGEGGPQPPRPPRYETGGYPGDLLPSPGHCPVCGLPADSAEGEGHPL